MLSPEPTLIPLCAVIIPTESTLVTSSYVNVPPIVTFPEKSAVVPVTFPVNVADDPLSCVAIGTGKALDQEETFSSVLSEY